MLAVPVRGPSHFALLQDMTSSTATPHFANAVSWRGFMSKNPPPKVGCFVITYPSTTWNATKCVTAPPIPLTHSLMPSTVGGAYGDWVAESPSTLIGSSVGGFSSVTGLTSESDSSAGSNRYSLQVNTNTFSTTTSYTGGQMATGWEQFVYLNYVGCYGTLCTACFVSGCTYIQYWLIGHDSSCTSYTAPPGGTSWSYFAGTATEASGCYANGPAVSAPSEAATNLANMLMIGFSNYESSTYGSIDEGEFCVSDTCYGMGVTDQVLNLYQNWQDSEFNIFGYGGGSEANFNSGTTITITNGLTDQNGNIISPSCPSSPFSYTAEENNLNLGPCLTSGNRIVFPESTSYIVTFDTNPTSFLGASSVGSISACGGTFTNGQYSTNCGSSFSPTANLPSPSSGWDFDHWEHGGGVTCSSNIQNPGSCTVSGSSGYLQADYGAQITFDTSPSTVGSISWGCSSTDYTNGQSIFDPNLEPEFSNTETACANVPSGYVFSGWSASGGLSLSSSSSTPTTVTVGGPGTLTLDLNQVVSTTQTYTTTTSSTTSTMTSSTSTFLTTTTTTSISTATVGQVCTTTSTSTTQTTSIIGEATVTSPTTTTTTTSTTTTGTSTSLTTTSSTSISTTVTTTTVTVCTGTRTTTTTSTAVSTSTIPPTPLSSLAGFTGDASGQVLLVIGDLTVNGLNHGSKCCGVGYQVGRDTTPLGFISGMLTNPQPTVFDDNTAYVDTSTGRPTTTAPLIFVIGGDGVNMVTNYYETTSNPADQAPLTVSEVNGNYMWTNRTGMQVASVPASSVAIPPGNKDVCVIEILTDASGRMVVILYGVTYLGVWASAWYFENVIYPNIASYTHSYYVLQWTAGADYAPDASNQFTILAQGS